MIIPGRAEGLEGGLREDLRHTLEGFGVSGHWPVVGLELGIQSLREEAGWLIGVGGIDRGTTVFVGYQIESVKGVAAHRVIQGLNH